jgi:hypothetical protein
VRNLLEVVENQARSELGQREKEHAYQAVVEYINGMSNYEFLELLDRALDKK